MFSENVIELMTSPIISQDYNVTVSYHCCNRIAQLNYYDLPLLLSCVGIVILSTSISMVLDWFLLMFFNWAHEAVVHSQHQLLFKCISWFILVNSTPPAKLPSYLVNFTNLSGAHSSEISGKTTCTFSSLLIIPKQK